MKIKHYKKLFAVGVLLLTLTAIFAHAADPLAFPPDAGMYNVKNYGATGDGQTDDTKAIQDAISVDPVDFTRPKVLYFPAGTYIVSDRIFMFMVGNSNHCCLTIQGQGPEHSIVKLKDNAAGYTDASSKKPIFQTTSGNEAFRYSVFDLTINVGSGNHGAVGIDYVANNQGSIENCHFISENGDGHIGIDLTRAWPGPLLIKNCVVDGFDYAIRVAHAEYGPTFEHLTFRNQKLAGFHNTGNTLSIRKLTSDNSVPAIEQNGGLTIILDSELNGGNNSNSAIEISGGGLYARDVTSNGYSNTISCKGDNVSGTVDEYVSDAHKTLFGDAGSSLNLPVLDAPPDYHDNDLGNWTNINNYTMVNAYGNEMPDIQAAMYSGFSTIYIPTRRSVGYPIYWDLYIPPNVKCIYGFEALLGGGTSERPVRIYTEGDTDDPLFIIGPIDISIHEFVHSSSRPLVIKHAGINVITNTPGAGPIFLEDVIAHLRISDGQWLWARQLNSESVADEGSGIVKLINNASFLWILGIKTEGDGPVIKTSNGGSSEVLGSLLYPTSFFADPVWNQAAFINDESCHSFVISHSNYGGERTTYKYIAEDTRGGSTERLGIDQLYGRNMPLYVGNKGCTVPNPPPQPTVSYVNAPANAKNGLQNTSKLEFQGPKKVTALIPGSYSGLQIPVPANSRGFEIFDAQGKRIWVFKKQSLKTATVVSLPDNLPQGISFIKHIYY